LINHPTGHLPVLEAEDKW